MSIMSLELGKMLMLDNQRRELMEQMKNEVKFWCSSNGLSEKYFISKLNGFHLILEGFDEPLGDELVNDFEVVFGVLCESISECKVVDVIRGGSSVKYSYCFVEDSGNIF